LALRRAAGALSRVGHADRLAAGDRPGPLVKTSLDREPIAPLGSERFSGMDLIS
jgi:hypothetical protein